MITYASMPIKDPAAMQVLFSTVNAGIIKKCDPVEFVSLYNDWIGNSNNFKIHGLHNFTCDVVDGITGAFDNFHYAYPTLETVIFAGEYKYHSRLGATTIASPSQLKTGQKLIITVPFAATGEIHLHFDEVIAECEKLHIPVFVDCALFGTTKQPDLKLDYDCIVAIAFSPSKTFSTGPLSRIGVCYHRIEKPTPMVVQRDYEYMNHMSMNIHTALLKNFSADYMYNKYVDKQNEIAYKLNVTPSSTVFLCYTDDPKWSQFRQENGVYRFGIAELLISDVDKLDVDILIKNATLAYKHQHVDK